MLAFFLLGTVLLLTLLMLARWTAEADPHTLVKGVRYGGGAAAAGLALYLLVSGRWPFALAAAGSALPLLLRWRAFWQRRQAASGPRPGQHSEVETASLRMRLDHETGAMSGMVLRGSAAGAELDALGREALAALLATCARDDPASVPLLESYLERRFGADWREALGLGEAAEEEVRHAPRDSQRMSREEARQILGVGEDAAPSEVKEAYRRLMLKLHPDHGGSGYLAAKLNQAKAVLLGE